MNERCNASRIYDVESEQWTDWVDLGYQAVSVPRTSAPFEEAPTAPSRNLNTLFRSAGHPRSRPKAGAGHGLRFSGATRRWKTTYLESQVLTFYSSGVRAGGFGAAAGIAALFYTSGIPRIQKDILQKIPILGNQFVKEVHPADNTKGKHCELEL
ncbi:unnamed protein product [Colletotrichum noveboracense]|uniref:Uncharacterized protein n=1 Tax=Colletotrichum noveboracense TaxID=2664923 RepID=A0A9W4WDI3_9PEZI|nr:unnamed protein product [Colletotrichum noveboracense]